MGCGWVSCIQIFYFFFFTTCNLLLNNLQMVVEDLIHTDDKPSVLRSLLLRHRHVNEHQSGFPFTKRKYSSYTSLQVCKILILCFFFLIMIICNRKFIITIILVFFIYLVLQYTFVFFLFFHYYWWLHYV